MNIEESGSGSISQRHGSADPDSDPHQNVMDPQHCMVKEKFFICAKTVSVKELDLLNRNQTPKFLKVVVAFRYTETVIDVDGSGPIPPVAVRCEFFPDGRNITYVDHSQMESTRVRKSLVFVQKI
jgi:hypothetical protein